MLLLKCQRGIVSFQNALFIMHMKVITTDVGFYYNPLSTKHAE